MIKFFIKSTMLPFCSKVYSGDENIDYWTSETDKMLNCGYVSVKSVHIQRFQKSDIIDFFLDCITYKPIISHK